ncbi:MAG TPA: glycosyltransferase family 4 protein [Microlunatus sp.]
MSTTTGTPARIAFVCTDPGVPIFGTKGASVHAQSVIAEFVAAGHQVHVITPRPGAYEDHRLAPSVQLHRLPEIGRGSAAEREHRAQAADRRVGEVLQRIHPDLVYERYALWGRTATRWAAGHRVPSILEVNAPLIDEQAEFRELADPGQARLVARSAFATADAVVCVSDRVAGWVRDLSSRPETIMVLPNGVDTERIRPALRPIAGESDDHFTVGFLGTLKPWHGVESLIDALAPAGLNEPGWRLLVVGDGPLREELVARADAAGVDAEFTGAVRPEQVCGQLQRMDVATAPYPRSDDHYFSPLKIYEYLAAGLPVIASAIGQVPDALDHGRLGRLVRPGDPSALAVALSQLRRDRPERGRLSVAARQAAEERHTWTAVVGRALAAVGFRLGGSATVPADGRDRLQSTVVATAAVRTGR